MLTQFFFIFIKYLSINFINRYSDVQLSPRLTGCSLPALIFTVSSVSIVQHEKNTGSHFGD